MALELVALCVDATDPLGLARFWAEAMRWEIGAQTDDRVSLVPTDVTSFRMDFLAAPTPKLGPNQAHLDLTTSSLEDQRDTAARLVDLGGRHIDIGQTPEEGHLVLADPEGNELCLIGPGNRFLAGCPRMGAISCDGSQEVGYFWSAALGWPLVWDQDEETAIQAPDGTGPKITWGGPPVNPKLGTNRFQLEIAPTDGAEVTTEVDRLRTLGATSADGGGAALLDPDGNELRVVPRTDGRTRSAAPRHLPVAEGPVAAARLGDEVVPPGPAGLRRAARRRGGALNAGALSPPPGPRGRGWRRGGAPTPRS